MKEKGEPTFQPRNRIDGIPKGRKFIFLLRRTLQVDLHVLNSYYFNGTGGSFDSFQTYKSVCKVV